MGYATDKVEQNKFVIKAVQFEDVASGKVKVNTVLSGFKGVDLDEDLAFQSTAPQLLVQSSVGYDTYYYLNNAYVDDDTSKLGWADADGVYTDLELTPGTAVWVKVPGGDANTAMAGAVSADSEVRVEVPADKFTLVGSGYPVPVVLNGGKMVCDGIKGVDLDADLAFQSTAPQLLVQSSVGYDTYYYLNNAYVDDDTSRPGWADADGVYVELEVAIGKGFWIKSASPLTVRFTP